MSISGRVDSCSRLTADEENHRPVEVDAETLGTGGVERRAAREATIGRAAAERAAVRARAALRDWLDRESIAVVVEKN